MAKCPLSYIDWESLNLFLAYTVGLSLGDRDLTYNGYVNNEIGLYSTIRELSQIWGQCLL